MYHPLFFLPPVVVIVMLLKSKINIKFYKIFMFTIAGAFVIVYLYRMFIGDGNVVVFEPEQDIASQASQVFNKAEQELGSAFNEVKQSFTGSNNQNNNQGYNANQNYSNGYNNGTIPPYSGTRLKDDRGLASYIILSIITCGIYSYYFIYKMAHDVNIACEGDGENTSGLVAFILLSLITCGIYAWFWYYNLGNRLAANGPRYGLSIQENGTTVLLWQIFGAFICGIGPFVAMHILIKNSNKICNAYNRAHGLM